MTSRNTEHGYLSLIDPVFGMIKEQGYSKRRRGTRVLFATILVNALMACGAVTVHDLNGTWELSGSDEHGKDVQCAISVPGGIYSALLNANAIPDPYWRLNESKVQWPRRKEWTIRREFDLDASFLDSESVILRLEAGVYPFF